MRENVVILAIGLSGSSVLTALVNRANYSLAGPTVEKKDYNTFENTELVRLNKRLLEASDSTKFGVVYRPEFIERTKALYGKIDDSDFRAFAKHLESQQPWLWKDPSLSVTIHYWKHFLDLSKIKFIINDREPMQSWISWNIRRQIQSFDYAKRYSDNVMGAIVAFLEEHGLSYIHVRYEDLICQPEATLERINRYLGSALTLDDLAKVYSGPLRKKTHGLQSFVKASLIYLKNYKQRYA